MMVVLRVSLFVVMVLVVKSFATEIRWDEGTCNSRCTFEKDVISEVVRLATEVKTLRTDVSNTVSNVDEIGKQMKPSVYFHALNVNSMSPGIGDTLAFVNVLRDSNNTYNTQAGTFTAPMKGLYWFAAYICNSPYQWLLFHITVNGEKLTNGLAYDATPNCNSANMVTELQPGDNVYIIVGDKFGYKPIYEDQNRACMFTGALIN